MRNPLTYKSFLFFSISTHIHFVLCPVQGLWKAEIFKDGINADRNGNDYKIEEQNIVSGKKLKVTMAPGGGWSAIISRIN